VTEQLAEGVFLVRPRTPAIDRTNSLVVLRDDGPLVIESQPSVVAARELLSLIAAIDARPVRFLVLSHPHVESIGGATAFPETTLVVASGGCRRMLEDPAYDAGAELRAAAPSPDSWAAPARRLPVLLADGPITLADSRNPVAMFPVGVAHSSGDLLLQLPRSGILYAGALVALDGNPYAPDGDLMGWLDVLNQLGQIAFETVVPLRGPRASRDDVGHFRDGLAWIRGQVEVGLREGVPWEDIPNFVVQSHRFAEYFDPRAIPAFHGLLVEKVLREADQQRTKRMLPSIRPK